jgi:hypothetical protein
MQHYIVRAIATEAVHSLHEIEILPWHNPLVSDSCRELKLWRAHKLLHMDQRHSAKNTSYYPTPFSKGASQRNTSLLRIVRKGCNELCISCFHLLLRQSEQSTTLWAQKKPKLDLQLRLKPPLKAPTSPGKA